MKIGLFFGTFNPIHIGHLIIINHILEFSRLDQIWIIVSRRSPHKLKKNILNIYERLHLVNLAINGYNKIKILDIESELPEPSYTINTLIYLKNNLNEFSLILGQDNLYNFNTWKSYKYIIKHYELIIYPRIFNSNQKKYKINAKITKIKGPIIEISSTLIRKMIQNNQNVKPLLTLDVFNYIYLNKLYKNLN